MRVYETNPRELDALMRALSPAYNQMLGAWSRAEAAAVTREARKTNDFQEVVRSLKYTMPDSQREFLIGDTPLRYDKLYEDFNRISLTGVGSSGKKLQKFARDELQRRFVFNATTESTIRFSREISLGLIKNVTMQRGQVLRSLFSEAATKDLPFTDAVELLRQSITITPKQANWVRNTYEKVRAESGRKEALISARKHAEKIRINRARTVIRTETVRLMNEGKIEAGRQMRDRGIVEKVMKMWVSTAFNDNWPSSTMNDGQIVELDETFHSGDTSESEINGRCVIDLVFFENNRAVQRANTYYSYAIMKILKLYILKKYGERRYR